MATIEERKLEVLLFLRKVYSTGTRQVSEKDTKGLLAQFKTQDPIYISLNHNTVIKCFKIKNKFYRAYYNLFDYTIVDEILE